eukprot:scaffold1996_cov235-Pinguiococcus_pyrenoidosus.AAC.4
MGELEVGSTSVSSYSAQPRGSVHSGDKDAEVTLAYPRCNSASQGGMEHCEAIEHRVLPVVHTTNGCGDPRAYCNATCKRRAVLEYYVLLRLAKLHVKNESFIRLDASSNCRALRVFGGANPRRLQRIPEASGDTSSNLGYTGTPAK